MIPKDYPLIPMNEITDEARELAKSWYDGVSEMNDIRQKHKLASDIMNYARRYHESQKKLSQQPGGKVYELVPIYLEFLKTREPNPSLSLSAHFLKYLEAEGYKLIRLSNGGEGMKRKNILIL